MNGWSLAAILLHAGCGVLYALLGVLILARRRPSRTGLILAGACMVTAIWGGAVAVASAQRYGVVAGVFDLLRPAAWFGFVLHLYRRTVSGPGRNSQRWVAICLALVLVATVVILVGQGQTSGVVALWSVWVVGRLGLAVGTLLVIENLYLNTPADGRWHINLPCIGLGALSIYDIALSGNALLYRQVSPALFDGRAIAIAMVAPLLAVAVARNRRAWATDLYVSRTAVFHSATLLVSGVFLLGLVAAGETFRYFGAAWGGVAEISLIFAGLITLAVLLTSRSARSRLQGVLIEHFFSHRYDYRREWIRCIATLSTPDSYISLHTRVIRAIAEVVDSPGGILFLREQMEGAPEATAFQWAGSWNMPAASAPVMADHALIGQFRGGGWVVPLADGGLAGLPTAWLAVPLAHGDRLAGFVLTAAPRAAFKLEREVYDLLRILGRQTAAYVAEQRATERLLQARQLHEYGKRFAFVAHDIKNVSSQLSLLLSNAETYLDNPDFQRDMLATIRASVDKIGALIKRLQVPDDNASRAVIMPAARLEAIVAGIGRGRAAAVGFETDGREAGIAMSAPAFDAVVTHLLDNALQATEAAMDARTEPRGGRRGAWAAADKADAKPQVRIVLTHERRRAVIEIVDAGCGMTPEFVRDELFRPFRTSKVDGSGIGAFQARDLLREAGGDLIVDSAPDRGTTMRILLPLVEGPAGVAPGISPGTPSVMAAGAQATG